MNYKLKFVSLIRETPEKYAITFNIVKEVVNQNGEVVEEVIGNLHLILKDFEINSFDLQKNYLISIVENA